MAIVFFGTPQFAIPSLKALIASGEDIAAVVTRRDAAKGRGKKILPPPVKELAVSHGLNVLQPASMKDPAFLSALKAVGPEFIVVVAYGRILTDEILAAPSIAPVNVHASLLPQYRGASPVAWAILNGGKETGVTTMIMARELDTGDILLQEATPINDEDTTESLSGRLSEMGAALLVKTLKGMREGTIKRVPQTGQSSYAPPLKKDDGLINWDRPAKELHNFVRGMSPWPGAFTFLEGERLIITRAAAISGQGRPGVIEKTRDELLAGTKEGFLKILEVQPGGKKPMNTKAFLAGRHIKTGGSFANA